MKQSILHALIVGGLLVSGQAIANDSENFARKDNVHSRFADLVAQINTNTADIATNAANISANSAAISANASGIAANAAAIAAIQPPVVFDYKTYAAAANITTKVFALSANFCGDTETRTLTRTPNGANTDLTVRRQWTNAGATCQIREFHYTSTDTDQFLTGSTRYNNSGVITSTITLDNPISLRNSTMQTGIDFGSASLFTENFVSGGSTTNMIMENRVVLGVEAITVPAGTFQDCLKTGVSRQSSRFGTFQRISWRCPGLGEVKRMQQSVDGITYRVWELTSYTTTP